MELQHSLNFSTDQFNKLFPFYLKLDCEMMIRTVGVSMEKLIGPVSDKPFSDFFEWVRPDGNSCPINTLRTDSNQLVIFRRKGKHPILFRGQFVAMQESDAFLFAGSPWLTRVEEMEACGLKLADFAVNDPMTDLLHVLKTKEIAFSELSELLEQSAEQQQALKQAHQVIQNINHSLDESIQRHDYVLKATTGIIWDWDFVNDQIIFESNFKTYFGYNDGLYANAMHFVKSKIHPDDLNLVRELLEQAFSEKSYQSVWEAEFRVLKADGNWAYISDHAWIIRDAGGRVTRMVGQIMDITQRNQEEGRLRLLESVITNINDAVLITEPYPLNDPGPRILFVNHAFTRMTGYDLADVIGKTPRILQGPLSEKEEIKRLGRALRLQQPCAITTINYKKDGSPFWINLSITPVHNQYGICTQWIAVGRDVSAEKTAQFELIRQKKFWEDILDNLQADIVVFNNRHEYLYVNPHAIRDENTRQWIIGKTDFDYCAQKKLPRSRAEFREVQFQKAMETRAQVEWVDEHPRENGRIQYVLREFYPMFEHGELKYMLGYGIDITERQQMEIQLQQSIQEIRKTNAELEQFAYVASHDLQEPLRMVTGFLTNLDRKYSEVLDDRGKEFIRFAVDGASRMRQIILDLLEFSRVGRSDGQKEWIPLQELIAEIEGLFLQKIVEKGASIDYSNLPSVFAARTPLRQLLQNLISNSLKYTKPDVPPLIRISASEEPGRWVIQVADNGIGIDSKYHDKIFAIFQRLHTRSEFDGTGIGLAISRKIVENMNGEIWLESAPGKGSNFFFSIPLRFDRPIE